MNKDRELKISKTVNGVFVYISIMATCLIYMVLLYFYYARGLEIIVAFPIATIITIILGLAAGFAVNKITLIKRKVIFYFSSILLILLLISTSIPTDGGVSPLVYLINNSISKLKNFK